MKYVQPYGIADTDAPYINGDPSLGRQGSIPPAAAFEHPMREIINVVTKNKIAPDAADLGQMLKAMRSQRVNYVDDTGSTNNLSVALDPPLGAYTVGLPLRVRIYATNTGGSSIDAGAGRVPIKLMNGGATGAGDLPAGGICELVYDGSAFQLVNFFGLTSAGGGDTSEFLIKIPYCVDSSPTPNIVVANFTPAITTLAAGDPLLVKIANTNSGSSIIRVNGLPDKAIRANGGGTAPLIQGDLTAGDVVLFLFDGTDFWIQPNPLISASTTINVPGQYSSVENALLAIRRKIIAQNATVTVLLAIGTFPPFTINHGNADRIVVRGTMKIAGNMSGSYFAQTGNSPAARAQDSANNIAMLRQHFGTEIQQPATTGIAITNASGSGMPTIQDLLITGPNYWSGAPIGAWNGVSLSGAGRAIACYNVTCWGLDIGFYGGGNLFCYYCFASGCFRNGFQVTGNAMLAFQYSGSFGNWAGMTANQNSTILTYSSWSNYNANFGAYVTDVGEITWHTSQAQGNGSIDLVAGSICEIVMLQTAAGGGVGTTSPERGYMNGYSGLIITDGG